METFFKYHGLGNDFVVLDRRVSGVDIDEATSRRLCDRHTGVGADGVLTLLPHRHAVARMVVHNADGSVAQMCGNGLRCVVKYLAERAPSPPASLSIATGAGILECAIDWRDAGVSAVTVAMGPAHLQASILPGGGPFVAQPVEGHVGTAVSMGNPHLVLLDTPATLAPELGPALERHPSFPERANVEFVEVRDDGLRVTVWERGVGLTLACGTGACAALTAAALAGRAPFDRWVAVELPGGTLEIKVARDLSGVWLRGPATFVFEGVWP